MSRRAFLSAFTLGLIAPGALAEILKRSNAKMHGQRDRAMIASKKPSLSIVDVDDNYYVLLVSDKRKDRMEFRVHKDGGKLPEIVDSFFMNYCGKKALIVILQADADTSITAGSTYDNWVLDRATGKVIDVIGAGEISDRITGEVISDSQKAIIAKLKSGIQSADECK